MLGKLKHILGKLFDVNSPTKIFDEKLRGGK